MIQEINQTSKIAESSNASKKIPTKCALYNIIVCDYNLI